MDKSDDELAQSLRRFIDSVTVMPARSGEEPEIRVAGGLASLLPLESRRSGLLGEAVAGARYIRQKRAITADFVFAA
jgi:hypothetical protein